MARDNENHDSQGDGRFDFGGFLGFENPTTTPTPDLLFDKIMQDLKESELKVLLYIIRRTFGFKKKSDDISLSQLVDGIKTKDGRTLDRGTGLSKSSVKRALQSLKKKNLINAQKNIDPKRGNLPTTYSLRMFDPRPATEPRVGSPVDQGSAHQRTPQQTVKQQTDSVVVKELIKHGITEKIAQELAAEYPESLIREKVDLLDYLADVKSPLVSRNPAGYLLKAITENYTPPKGFKTRAEQEVEDREEEHRQQEIEEEIQAEKEQEQARIKQIIDAYEITEENINLWNLVLEQIKSDASKATFDNWFSSTYLVSVEDGVAYIGTENPEAQEWLTARGKAVVSNLLTGVLGEKVSVTFEVLAL